MQTLYQANLEYPRVLSMNLYILSKNCLEYLDLMEHRSF
ncbi:hypothetical protein ECTW09195_3582, partial [Escherichia coli TW09195]